MGYTIFVLPQVTPKFIKRNGPSGPESCLNLGSKPVYPRTFSRCLYSDTSDRYSDDPTTRTELWEDSTGTAGDADVLAACPGIRDWKASQIRMEGNFRLNRIATPYMDAERETWQDQKFEALAFLQDASAPTPMIEKIAERRGISKSDLVAKIMENANLFRPIAGDILGQQQALLDQIYATQSVAELLAVTWPPA